MNDVKDHLLALEQAISHKLSSAKGNRGCVSLENALGPHVENFLPFECPVEAKNRALPRSNLETECPGPNLLLSIYIYVSRILTPPLGYECK